MTPIEAAEHALAADRAHDDPAIWITRLPDAEVLARARALEAEGPQGSSPLGRAVRGEGQHRHCRFAHYCGVPRLCLYTADNSARSAAPAGCRCAADRQDQPGSVRDRTGRDAQLRMVCPATCSTRRMFQAVRHPVPRALSPRASFRFALGTDTAGSGRVPAAFGNIVGLKPTLGSVSARGMVPACRSLDTISVFAPIGR